MVTTNSVNSKNPMHQMVYASSNAYASYNVNIPLDDTIPQNNEGTEWLTLAITPSSATSILEIESQIPVSVIPGSVQGMALFRDATANALQCCFCNWGSDAGGGRGLGIMRLIHRVASGSTAATTFKIRINGRGSGNTLYVNGNETERKYGGVSIGWLTIKEYLNL